jgi:hypothetical protein
VWQLPLPVHGPEDAPDVSKQVIMPWHSVARLTELSWQLLHGAMEPEE